MPFRVETAWRHGYLKLYRKPTSHPFRLAETSTWRQSIRYRFIIETGDDATLRPLIEFTDPAMVDVPDEGRGTWSGYVLYDTEIDEAIHSQRVHLPAIYETIDLNG